MPGKRGAFREVRQETEEARTKWRREWDSNPRYGSPYTRFPSVRLKPLGHPSTPGTGTFRPRAGGADVAGGRRFDKRRPVELAGIQLAVIAWKQNPAGVVYARRKGFSAMTNETIEGRRSMIVGRIIGYLLLLAALAVAARDVFGWADAGSYHAIATGELWFTLHNGSLNLMQAVIQRYIAPSLWDPVIVTVLLWPAWLVFGVPGAVLAAVFHRRSRRSKFRN